jgi:glycosyltransferase involved in cell wall biosynthesis
MWPSPERPAFGRFVYDQVAALRKLDGVSLELFTFSGGSPAAYARAALQARRLFRGRSFDVVHAHFGLAAWPALMIGAPVRAVTLHGTDLAHPISRPATLAALRALEIVGVVSAELGEAIPRWALHSAGSVEVLPCGVDLQRFRTIDRSAARSELGLDLHGRYLLFAADPARPEKRFDLASELAEFLDAQLLTLGGVDPGRVPLYVNAAAAVLVPSDREGFGLACLEALACDVPVLATAHGIAPEALQGIEGCLCEEFSVAGWASVADRALSDPNPRVAGRTVAERYSADAMAARVLASWRSHAR